MNEAARAERALYLAIASLDNRTGLTHGEGLQRVRQAAVTFAKFTTETRTRTRLTRTCEMCDAPAVHAEHFYERIRAWCASHVPWSGHYEHCDETCERLCTEPG